MKVLLFVFVLLAVAMANPAEKCEWKSIHFEDYEKGAVGWTNNAVTDCDCRKVLGGPGKFAGGEVSKVFEGLPKHTHLRLLANYFFIDDWDHETAFAKLDDELVWTKESHDSSWSGINLCGNESADFINEVVDVVIPHKKDCAKVAFGSNLDEPATNEAFGIGSLHLMVCEFHGHESKCSK